MKNLKLITLLILSLTLTGTGCSSDDDGNNNDLDSEYYISYEVNNKKIVYTNVISASHNDNSTLGIYGVSMLGAEANTALAIYLYDTEHINTTTYTSDIIPNKYLSSAIISYGTEIEGFTSAAPNISSVANAEVIITEINATYIAGHFSGTLVATSDYNTITHIINNGKFKIKFLNN